MDIPNKNRDDELKQLLRDSRLEMPFDDFEERVMSHLKKEVQSEKSIDRNIRLSWLFFVLGTAFGLLVSVIISPVTSILGFSVSKLMIPLYIVGATLLLLFFEQLVNITIERKKHRG